MNPNIPNSTKNINGQNYDRLNNLDKIAAEHQKLAYEIAKIQHADDDGNAQEILATMVIEAFFEGYQQGLQEAEHSPKLQNSKPIKKVGWGSSS